MNSYETNLALLKAWHNIKAIVDQARLYHPWIEGMPTITFTEEGCDVITNRCWYPRSQHEPIWQHQGCGNDPEMVVVAVMTDLQNQAKRVMREFYGLPALSADHTWQKRLKFVIEYLDREVTKSIAKAA